jgi:hypothetical protein
VPTCVRARTVVRPTRRAATSRADARSGPFENLFGSVQMNFSDNSVSKLLQAVNSKVEDQV